jgi:steroid delta-isomerase-like uncharacterized protein
MLSPSVQALFDVMTGLWNTGNPALLSQVYSAEAVRVDPLNPEPARGIQQIGATLSAARAGFPDFQLHIKQRIGDDEWVVTEWSTTGTHTGAFMGVPPTGRAATLHGVSVTRISGLKIVEERGYFDRLALLQQLGVGPGAAQSAAAAAARP